jgi:hypothetical protein
MSSRTEQFRAILRESCLERVVDLVSSDGVRDSHWLDEAAKWAVIAEALRPDTVPQELVSNDVAIWNGEPMPDVD